MMDLVKALTIFLKYADDKRSCTTCEHDTLYVCINPALVSPEDKARLEVLGFTACPEDENFYSYRFGSC